MTNDQDSGDYHRKLVESAPDALLVVNGAGLIELANRQAEVLFGYTRAELVGRPVDLLVPERAKSIHPTHRARYFTDRRTRPMGVGLALTARRKDGSEVPVDISLSPLDTEAGTAVAVAIRDVTERERADSALQEAYRKLASSVRDLERHDREMTLVNEMGDLLQSCMTRAEANEVISRYGSQLFPSSSGTMFTSARLRTVFEAAAAWGPALGQTVLEREECWALRRGRLHAVESSDGGPVCHHVGPARPVRYVCVPMMAQGEALGLFHVRLASPEGFEGLTFESQRTLALTVAEHLALALANLSLRETLRHQSVSDPLTGVYNRRYMQDHLRRELDRAARGHRTLGIVLADVDHLKEVNDRLGHSAGDEALRAVARVLEESVREGDTVCRFGGDEFVLVLPDSTLGVTQQRAEQLREAVRRLGFGASDGTSPISLSIGVAVYPEHGTSVDAILAAADAAMYRAKDQGRNRVASAAE